MRQIIIDCAGCKTPKQLHIMLKDALGFPEWSGCNLDALHDNLCAIRQETRMVLVHMGELPFPSGGFVRVLDDCSQENPRLKISIHP